MQEKSERRRQEDRAAAMRERLIAAARELFVAKGYAETGTPEIVAAAGVTRGALYHHFADKADLFRAVAEAEAREAATPIAAVPPGPGALRQGAKAWFRAMAVPGRVRILLIDGPAVLGPAVMAEIDASAGGAELSDGLAWRFGLKEGPELTALTELASAAFDRAALAVAAGGDPAVYLDAAMRLLEGPVA